MLSIPRCSGILLHPTSLPGRFGIGEIGRGAELWLEALHRMGQRAGGCCRSDPRATGTRRTSALSSCGEPASHQPGFAGEGRLVRPSTWQSSRSFPMIMSTSAPCWRSAHGLPGGMPRTSSSSSAAPAPCCSAPSKLSASGESEWLDDWACSSRSRGSTELRPWTEWPKVALLCGDEVAMAEVMAGLEEEIEAAKVLQFFFHRQWNKLGLRAKELDISIIEDIPIFAAHDSADVWANRHLFHWMSTSNPTVVAGVPPITLPRPASAGAIRSTTGRRTRKRTSPGGRRACVRRSR